MTYKFGDCEKQARSFHNTAKLSCTSPLQPPTHRTLCTHLSATENFLVASPGLIVMECYLVLKEAL